MARLVHKTVIGTSDSMTYRYLVGVYLYFMNADSISSKANADWINVMYDMVVKHTSNKKWVSTNISIFQ